MRQYIPKAEVVRERFAEVSGRVAEAAAAAGRDPAEVRIVVATKYVVAEHLGALRDAGVSLIGENRAQDLVAKHAMYGDAFDYHFIGHLQSRKVRLVVPLVSLIHSVSTMSVVQEIEARAANAT
ncbi:MAG: YggS family pyridoxal phosphate-dependent enzyme, partial [Actinobacteria bacterium]|nr:YggS family pyridoxal phosphate-dependent enzyme [Actinomycetota bacterium]